MGDDSDWMERRPGEYLRFALSFFGLMIAIGGVVASSALTALAGALLLLLCALSFCAEP